jgi:CheY-like chemotaxis protein
MKSLLGVNVLLVEDDEDTRELFAFALQEAGADVRTASDATGAMRTVLQWNPSIIVSDLAMPSTDGFSLLRGVRSVDALRQIPAIAVSGLAREKDRTDALAAGFQEHLSKPLAPDELVAVVKRWAQAPTT